MLFQKNREIDLEFTQIDDSCFYYYSLHSVSRHITLFKQYPITDYESGEFAR